MSKDSPVTDTMIRIRTIALESIQSLETLRQEKRSLRKLEPEKEAANALFSLSRYQHEIARHIDEIQNLSANIMLEDLGLRNEETLRTPNMWRVLYFLTNYRIVSRNVGGVIANFEGPACSVDKFKTLISFYLNLEINVRQGSRDIPIFISPITKKNSWAYVEDKKFLLWIEYLDALPYMTSGRVEEYVEVYKSLENEYEIHSK